MKLARFEYNGKIRDGMVEAEEIHVIEGSFWDRLEVTSEKYTISEVGILPPVLPSKVVCVGQNYAEHIAELGLPVPKEILQQESYPGVCGSKPDDR